MADKNFHLQIAQDISFIKGQLAEALPGMKSDIAALKTDVGVLKDDSLFKKGKVMGVSIVTSAVVAVVTWFIKP